MRSGTIGDLELALLAAEQLDARDAGHRLQARHHARCTAVSRSCIGSIDGPSSTSSWISWSRPAALVSSGGSVPSGKSPSTLAMRLGDLKRGCGTDRRSARTPPPPAPRRAARWRPRGARRAVPAAPARSAAPPRSRARRRRGRGSGSAPAPTAARDRGRDRACRLSAASSPAAASSSGRRPGPAAVARGRLRRSACRSERRLGSVGMLVASARRLSASALSR